MSRKALGRGLNALLRDFELEPAPATRAVAANQTTATADGVRELPVEAIDSSRFQPRASFAAAGLQELAESIRVGGVVQPVVVRPAGSRYELVAGERRLRAAKLAGLARIPALVRIVSDEQALELSLVENLQREDLNPVEQAHAFAQLAVTFGLTQEEIAERTGKDRATVANTLRLLKLPAEILELVEQGKLSAGHARALLKLEDDAVLQRVLARRMVARKVSVRQAEELVERKLPSAKPRRQAQTLDPNTQAALEAMQRALGTKVRIFEYKPHRGKIEIDYYTLDDLNRIYDAIVRSGAPTSTPTM